MLTYDIVSKYPDLCLFCLFVERIDIYVMRAADARRLLASSSVVHMGTNQKAQQSCRGGTS